MKFKLLLLSLLPTSVIAHSSNQHTASDIADLHFLKQADHLALLVLVSVGVYFVGKQVYSFITKNK